MLVTFKFVIKSLHNLIILQFFSFVELVLFNKIKKDFETINNLFDIHFMLLEYKYPTDNDKKILHSYKTVT